MVLTDRYRNPRDGSQPDDALAVHELMAPCLVQWTEVATNANDNAWSALDNVIRTVVMRRATGRPGIIERVM